MLTWLGKLFGIVDASNTAANLAEDISSGVDMMIYTDEEKAISGQKAFDAWLDMVKVMKGSEVYRSVTRRILAILIVLNLLAMIWLCIASEVCAFFGFFGMTTAEGFTPITMSVLKLAAVFQLGWVFCTIIVFYFGPHLIQFLTKGKTK
jgi:hypothetical protein